MTKIEFFKIVVATFCLGEVLGGAFLYQQPQAHPYLSTVSNVWDTEQVFRLKWDIEMKLPEGQQQQSPSRLALSGPSIQLKTESFKSKLALPGSTFYKSVSTGERLLQVLEPATYISLNKGQQTISLEKPCWEMIWVQENESGKLTCAFDLALPIHRNGVVLSAGPVFASFDIYSPETLAEAQARKLATLHKSRGLLLEKDECVAKGKAAQNPLAKAMHFQRAYAALDKMMVLPRVSHIPDASHGGNQDPVLPLNNGSLFVVREGVVWRKSSNPFMGPSSEKLGKVILSMVEPNTKNNPEDRLMP